MIQTLRPTDFNVSLAISPAGIFCSCGFGVPPVCGVSSGSGVGVFLGSGVLYGVGDAGGLEYVEPPPEELPLLDSVVSRKS